MNRDQVVGKWHELKGEAKIQWGKLTNDDLDTLDGSAEKLSGLIQQRYGYAKERAEEEVAAFRKRHNQN